MDPRRRPDLTMVPCGGYMGPSERRRSFGEAFAEARRIGVLEFIWRGGRYHTRTARGGRRAHRIPRLTTPAPPPRGRRGAPPGSTA